MAELRLRIANAIKAVRYSSTITIILGYNPDEGYAEMPSNPDPSRAALEAVGHEMKMNPPKQLAETAAKFGPERMRKQKIAILLSKARKQGVRKRWGK